MKATELKNGNLIIGTYESEDDNLIHESICDFKFYDCYNNYYYVESKEGIEEFTGFKPIPLSEEILLKCGFEKATWNKNYPLYFNRNETNYSDAISVSVYDDFCRVSIVDKSVKTLKYLHDLQNLYFALTNEELTVNL